MAEQSLWKRLRAKQVDGLKFRRQMPIGPYVVDFGCVSHRLVIEVDGGVHRLREAHDAERDAWLAGQSFTVVRFSNEDVLSRPNQVLDNVRTAAQGKHGVDIPHPSRPARHLPPQGGKEMTVEIWFYHLERSTLDQVLPGLLEKTLQRGWRALIRVADAERMGEIDDWLWTWRDDGFLAHGQAGGMHDARQPILLTTTRENPNKSQALFIVDGAELGATEEFERCFIIFDGRDDAALKAARERWKVLKQAGAELAYWKQTDEGRWEKAA